MIAAALTPFERFAIDKQFDIAAAVFPAPDRVYADMRTQTLFEAWNEGAASVARMLTESTLETPALRERILELPGRQ